MKISKLCVNGPTSDEPSACRTVNARESREANVNRAAVDGPVRRCSEENLSKVLTLSYLVLLAFLSSALALVPVLASPPSLTSMLEAFIL